MNENLSLTARGHDLLQALDQVLSWDPPDEAIPELLNDRYRLLTGTDPELDWVEPA